jgi:hypothetical protein
VKFQLRRDKQHIEAVQKAALTEHGLAIERLILRVGGPSSLASTVCNRSDCVPLANEQATA